MPARPQELERLVQAHSDITSASAGWALLTGWTKLEAAASGRHGFGRVDWQGARVALWTGAVVSYGRPFKRSTYRVDPEWEEFADRDLEARHKLVLTLRDKIFAHTDETPLRGVVLPAGGSAGGFGSPLHIGRFRQLCDFQLARLAARIADLEAGVVGGSP